MGTPRYGRPTTWRPSTVTTYRKIAGLDLPGKLKVALGEMLKSIGVPARLVDEELRQMSELTVGKAASLSVLGSMQDFKRMARFSCARALELAEAPCGPMAYRTPIEATLEAFGVEQRWKARAR